ncbi:hypothetical protein JCM18909_2298 [Cutibacterium acnes JCM 18909]|nr:hypothetical protein JCM18909_2298 [Cutibacterium acnes JCM 18909]
MIWAEPDWMRERAGNDVNPHILWTPWSSFLAGNRRHGPSDDPTRRPRSQLP